MFAEFAGLPTHPLIVHSAVTLVPIAAVLILVIALVPHLRTKLGAFPPVLSVVALVSTVLARSTGEAMLELIGLTEEDPGPVTDHATLANYLTIALIIMALAHLGWWAVESERFRDRFASQAHWLKPLALALTVLGAVVVVVLVILTGHEGANLTWHDLPKV